MRQSMIKSIMEYGASEMQKWLHNQPNLLAKGERDNEALKARAEKEIKSRDKNIKSTERFKFAGIFL